MKSTLEQILVKINKIWVKNMGYLVGLTEQVKFFGFGTLIFQFWYTTPN